MSRIPMEKRGRVEGCFGEAVQGPIAAHTCGKEGSAPLCAENLFSLTMRACRAHLTGEHSVQCWSGFCFALPALSTHNSLRKKRKALDFITLAQRNFLEVSFVQMFVREEKKVISEELKRLLAQGKDNGECMTCREDVVSLSLGDM